MRSTSIVLALLRAVSNTICSTKTRESWKPTPLSAIATFHIRIWITLLLDVENTGEFWRCAAISHDYRISFAGPVSALVLWSRIRLHLQVLHWNAGHA